MRQIIYTITACCLIYSQVFAFGLMMGKGSAPVSGTTYLLEESFNGTTAPSGWTDDGAYVDWSTAGRVDVDYNIGASCVSPTFTASSTLYTAIKLNFQTLDQAGDVFFLNIRNSNTDIITLKIRATDVLRLGHSGINTGCTSTFSVATDYYFWIDYIAGSGTDGQLDLYFNTSGDFDTATHEANIDTGTFTEAIDNIEFTQLNNDTTDVIQFLHIIVSTSPIGDFTDE